MRWTLVLRRRDERIGKAAATYDCNQLVGRHFIKPVILESTECQEDTKRVGEERKASWSLREGTGDGLGVQAISGSVQQAGAFLSSSPSVGALIFSSFLLFVASPFISPPRGCVIRRGPTRQCLRPGEPIHLDSIPAWHGRCPVTQGGSQRGHYPSFAHSCSS